MVIVPAHRAGDPGSNPGPGENFFSLLLIYDLSEDKGRLIKTVVPVEISRYSFRVFSCACPSVIS